MSVEPWQKAEIAGPIKAVPIKDPKALATIIKKYKKPIIIVGHLISKVEGMDLVEYIIDLAKTIDADVVVTNTLIRKFHERGFKRATYMPALEIIDRLRDPLWRGIHGDGNYDLAIFIGFQYYYEWLLLSSLKHFAYERLDTISLGPYFQPNAKWTVPTLPLNTWYKYLTDLKDSLTKSLRCKPREKNV